MQDTLTASHRTADRRMLIVALIAGAVAAGLIVAFLASQESSGGSSSAASDTTSFVVVADEDIEVGQTITSSMLELREVPASAVLASAATSLDQVVGETARYPIAAGEQMSNLRLVRPPVVKALSFQIPEGMRGFTIPVSTQTSPAALLVPGDFVDVLVANESASLLEPQRAAIVTTSEPDVDAAVDTPQAVVTLLQNVQVLSVQREYVDNGVPYDASVRGELPDEDSATYVTLALSPEDTQTLWLASQGGDITLALRAFGDDAIVDLGAVEGPVASR